MFPITWKHHVSNLVFEFKSAESPVPFMSICLLEENRFQLKEAHYFENKLKDFYIN